MKRFFLSILLLLIWSASLHAEDGYRLWLRYERITDEKLLAEYLPALGQIVLATPTGGESSTLTAARDELLAGLDGLLGLKPVVTVAPVAPTAEVGEEG